MYPEIALQRFQTGRVQGKPSVLYCLSDDGQTVAANIGGASTQSCGTASRSSRTSTDAVNRPKQYDWIVGRIQQLLCHSNVIAVTV